MKKTLVTILQLTVTIGLLYWVFHDPVVRDRMWSAIRQARYEWLVAAILAYVFVELAAVVRWHILMKVQGIHLSVPRVLGLFFIGMFFNQFLPGGTGGDIVKTYLLWKETPDKKSGALLAILFDRMIGLLALIIITGVLIFLRYGWLTQPVTLAPDQGQLYNPQFYVRVVLIVFGSSVLFFVSTFAISGFNLLRSLPHRFPGREKLIEISAAYHLYAHHWPTTVAAFFASVVCHLGTFATFYCVARAFQANVPLIDFFAVMPVERTVSSLPISFAGVGTREFVLQVMLMNLCHVPAEVTRLIGLMGFTVILFCCLPGGIVYLFYKPSGTTGHVRMREMKQEFATLEHEITEQEQ